MAPRECTLTTPNPVSIPQLSISWQSIEIIDQRISLRFYPRCWLELTAMEARQLAQTLNEYADALET